jgi:hypothetical protein
MRRLSPWVTLGGVRVSAVDCIGGVQVGAGFLLVECMRGEGRGQKICGAMGKSRVGLAGVR